MMLSVDILPLQEQAHFRKNSVAVGVGGGCVSRLPLVERGDKKAKWKVESEKSKVKSEHRGRPKMGGSNPGNPHTRSAKLLTFHLRLL